MTGAVRTAIWWLLPFAAACACDGTEDDAGGGDASTATDEDGQSDDDGETEPAACWDHVFEDGYDDGYYAAFGDPEWDPFVCELPQPCDAVHLNFYDGEEMTPEAIAAADAAARCILEALRDGSPAVHLASNSDETGQFSDHVRYQVLPDGVVGTLTWADDLVTGKREVYRATRDAAFFEACLAETELMPLAACVVPGLGGGSFPALDLDACIDGEPMCPE